MEDQDQPKAKKAKAAKPEAAPEVAPEVVQEPCPPPMTTDQRITALELRLAKLEESLRKRQMYSR